MHQIARGTHERKFYVCADVLGNYRQVYEEEFKKNGVNSILFGEMFFANLLHIQPPNIPHAIVEVHGVSPTMVNVGIYTDRNPFNYLGLIVRLVYRHIGNQYYQQISDKWGDQSIGID